MTHLLIQDLEKQQEHKKNPQIVPGATVKVHQIIKEGEKERVQIFEGLVIALNSGRGASKTFTVRKVVEGIGVEKVFPLFSPFISKIEIVSVGKVRRAKLYYMRGVSGKAARLKERLGAKKELMAEMELPVTKTPSTEAAPEATVEAAATPNE